MKKIFSVITIITFSILLLGCCETETKEEREARERAEREYELSDTERGTKGVAQVSDTGILIRNLRASIRAAGRREQDSGAERAYREAERSRLDPAGEPEGRLSSLWPRRLR